MRNSSIYLLLFFIALLSSEVLMTGFSSEANNIIKSEPPEKKKLNQSFLEPFTLPLQNHNFINPDKYPHKQIKNEFNLKKAEIKNKKNNASKDLSNKNEHHPKKIDNKSQQKPVTKKILKEKTQQEKEKTLAKETKDVVKTLIKAKEKQEKDKILKNKTPDQKNKNEETITKAVETEEEEEKEEEESKFPIPTRIICFTKSAISSIIALDKSVARIIAVTPESKQSAKNSFIESAHPEFFKISSSILSSNNYPHINAVKSFQPDFIIYDSFSHKNIKYNLKRHFKSEMLFELDILSEKRFNKSMKKLAHRMRKTKRWKEIYSYRKKMFDKIYNKTKKIPSYKRPKVMFLNKVILEYKLIPWSDAIYYWINLSGGTAFGYTKELTKFFIEKSWIEKVNPDYIFIDSSPYSGYPDHIYQSHDLKAVTAAQRTQVYKIPMNFNKFQRISIQSPMMWLFMAKLIQPTVFQDIDLIAEIKYFFETFLNVKKLTLEAIKQVLLYEHNQLSRHFLSIF